MHILRAWGLKTGILVVSMLAAIGAWEVYQGTVTLVRPAQARPMALERDLFQCYSIREVEPIPAGPPELIELMNQFGFESVVLGKSRLLCVPTTMTFCDGEVCSQ